MVVSFAVAILAHRVVTPQQHGAVADGMANDTRAVRAAAASCGGGCTLRFANGTFLTGPFSLSDGSTVELDGTIVAAPMAWWVPAGWEGVRAFVWTSGASSLTLRGSGTIDGQGADWWAGQRPVRNDSKWRPYLLRIEHSAGVVVSGIRLLNSPNHNLMFDNCSRVRVLGLRVEAPHDSPNTDGINFGGGSDQLVADSHISNGDDCVTAITSTSTPPPGPGPWPTLRAFGGSLVVRNMTCVGGHGVSIGSVRTGVVTNVTVEDVRFYRSDNGCRIKMYPNNLGRVSQIVFQRIWMEEVQHPIVINAEYCPPNQKPFPCPESNMAVNVSDVLFVRVSGTSASAETGSFTCSKASPCRRLTLRHVNIAPASGGTGHFSCKRAHGSADDVQPASCLEA